MLQYHTSYDLIMRNNKMFINVSIMSLVIALFAFFGNGCSGGGEGSEDSASGSSCSTPVTYATTCGGATFTSDTYTINSSINGQNNWYVDTGAGFEEEILNIGGGACRGSGVWLLNNNIWSGGYGNQPASPAFTSTYGDSSLRTGTGDSFSTSFFFKTVSATADGASFTVNISPTAQGRLNYLRFDNNTDGNGGLQIFAYDGSFNVDMVATNISRNTWHHVRIELEAPTGVSNDIVKVYLDGVLVDTHTSLEDYYAGVPEPTPLASRVMFRLAVDPPYVDGSFTTSSGFYIDDFTQRAYDSTCPGIALESYSTGFEP